MAPSFFLNFLLSRPCDLCRNMRHLVKEPPRSPYFPRGDPPSISLFPARLLTAAWFRWWRSRIKLFDGTVIGTAVLVPLYHRVRFSVGLFRPGPGLSFLTWSFPCLSRIELSPAAGAVIPLLSGRASAGTKILFRRPSARGRLRPFRPFPPSIGFLSPANPSSSVAPFFIRERLSPRCFPPTCPNRF